MVIAGATGRVGRHLTVALRAAGHQPVPVAPSSGTDVLSGAGLDAALAGADVVVDTTNSPRSDEAAATRFYKDVLGFSEIWRGGRSEGVTDWVNMRVPDGTDYLEYMLVSSPPDRRQRGVLHHVALLVPDIQAAWEAAGARTPAEKRAALGPPNVGRNGRWQLNLYDGDGTRTELMEPFTVR